MNRLTYIWIGAGLVVSIAWFIIFGEKKTIGGLFGLTLVITPIVFMVCGALFALAILIAIGLSSWASSRPKDRSVVSTHADLTDELLAKYSDESYPEHPDEDLDRPIYIAPGIYEGRLIEWERPTTRCSRSTLLRWCSPFVTRGCGVGSTSSPMILIPK